MDKVKKLAKIWLCIGLALMLLCCIVVSVVQTDGGKVDMQELMIETDSGYNMSAYLFVPDTATADNPAPAIVTSHGYLNNKEMQDANYVELARRGFVVLAVDQPSHGDSGTYEGWNLVNTNAVYEGAVALSRMPFVDVTRIGVTGHSMGGMSTNQSILADNENETPIIAAALLNCADPVYTVDDNYSNVYGSRDIAVVSAQYDEFFHQWKDDQGVLHEAPDYLEWANAQSFLNFGVDPTGLEARAADTIYTQDIDGEEAIRVIYRPEIIHPWSHFSARSTADVIDFFTEALDAPNPIDSGDQVWQWKEAFNCVGLAGLVIFICAFGTLMVYTPVFESLRAKEIAQPVKVSDGKGKLWFWLSLLAGALFSMLIYRWILKVGTSMTVSQKESMGLGLWSTLCGVFTILSMVLFYYCYGKKHGMDLTELGVKMPVKKLGLSVLLALIIAVMAYACVFAADYFFYADFRIWTLAVKAFEAPILKYLPYGLLFVTFYVSSSVATNCFNYNDIGGKSWVNTIIVALFTALPALILPWIQYIHYFNTGLMLWPSSNMHILWLFPIVLILFFSTIINRILYKVTKNPYIAGVVNAIIVALLTITNTCSTIV
ncbi:MAG: alpha/beta fold hydrolase [Oscillospiraceae bacterium]|nr:alpha/beta fold hydrolase [Oscillospiraceae bacterium]